MIKSLQECLPWLSGETVIDRRSQIKQEQRDSENNKADQVPCGSPVNCPDNQNYNAGDAEANTNPVGDAIGKYLAF